MGTGVTEPRCYHGNTHIRTPGAISDARVAELHAARSFDRDDLPAGFDPVHYARTVNIPVASAGAKFLGSDDDGALRAFAAKLWMIENAEYTLRISGLGKYCCD